MKRKITGLLSQPEDSISYSLVSPGTRMCRWVQQGKVPNLESSGLPAHSTVTQKISNIYPLLVSLFTMLFILDMGSQAENITQPDFCYLVCQTKAPLCFFTCIY